MLSLVVWDEKKREKIAREREEEEKMILVRGQVSIITGFAGTKKIEDARRKNDLVTREGSLLIRM